MMRLSQYFWRMSEPALCNRSTSTSQVRGQKRKANAARTVKLSPEVAKQIELEKYEENMRNTLEALKNSYAQMRSGLPSPSYLDDVPVEAYGSRTTLKCLAQVSVRDGRTMFITTFDDQVSQDVEKAVRKAGLNLNPIPEGKGRFRVPLPKPTKETRLAMKEVAQKEAEAAKVATRLVRRRAMEEIKGLKADLPKDDVKRLERTIQNMTDTWIDRIASTQRSKIEALMEPSLKIRK